MYWNPSALYRTRILVSCSIRRLLITQKKYTELCPFSTKGGDEIWLLAGARVPSVLRRAPEGGYIMSGEYFADKKQVSFDTVVLR